MPSNRVAPPLRQDEDSNDAGFTVLEVLVAFVLFAVMAGASTTAILNANASSNTTQDRVTAADLAQQDLQQARSLRDGIYPTAPAATYPKSVKVGNQTFTVNRQLNSTCPATTDADNRALAWVPGQAASMQVTTTVTWTGATVGVAVATEIAC
jgi:Tfp pilus assembly protein PilV